MCECFFSKNEIRLQSFPPRLPNVKSFTVPNLVCGRTYFAKVAAVSVIGPGPLSTRVDVKLAVAPSQPLDLRLVSSAVDKITLEWREPADTGCFEIKYYKVERDCGSGFTVLTSTLTATAYVDSALPPEAGAMCVYAVSARNTALGDYGAVSAYLSAYAATVSGAPQNLVLVFSTRNECSLSWGGPASNGGSSVIEYKIERDDGLGGEFVFVGKTTSTK